MKIYLVRSGFYAGGENFTKCFLKEETAWKWMFKNFGTRNLERKNTQQIKGFRGAILNKKKWALLTEHKVNKG